MDLYSLTVWGRRTDNPNFYPTIMLTAVWGRRTNNPNFYPTIMLTAVWGRRTNNPNFYPTIMITAFLFVNAFYKYNCKC